MPRDAATGEYQPAEARLAASTDDQTDRDEATPIARDEPFFFADRQEYTDEPARADIDDWTTEYDANPLLKRPIQLFTDDIFEPGYETAVRPTDPTQDVDSYEEPTVPTDYPNAQYHGLALSDALDRWLGRCGITADSFAKDATVVFKQALRDAYGRRGTGLVEHAYADPRERRRLVGLRPFQVDDVTAYTRAGKAILLRPDDDAESLRLDDSAGYEARRAPTLGLRDRDRDDIPTTMAGKTAAFVQYDDVYGTSENEEIALALDDVTMYPRDPDTGAVFGRPDTATVVPRATAIREIYQDVDQGVKNAAWNSIVANVNTDNQEEAKKMLSGLDPNNPESVSVTNTDPDIEVIDGQTPDVVNLIQQQIEYVISALPVSLYRVGFEGEINRDVTGEQSDDYADALSSARAWVESQARGILEQKACEFLTGHAHPEDVENPDAELYGDPSDVPDVALRIRPDKTSDPLRSEHFDAEAFAALIQGLKQAAPGGQVSQLVTGRAIVDLVPGWDPDEVMPGAAQEAAEMGTLAPLDEADPDVREQFAASMGLPAPETATNGEADEAALAWFDGDRPGVTFGNVGGDPFDDVDALESFLNDLNDAASGPVFIGDAKWPATDYAIHDRPVGVVGISENEASEIYERYADHALALGGPQEARLANRYSEGDIVDTPAGIGVVAAAISETVEDDALAETENVPDRIDASPDSPMYGVVTENAGQPVRFYKASELSMAEIDSDVDPFGEVGDEEAEAACPPSGEEQTAELAWSPPESWRESDTPARLIALDAFSSMGGKHGGSDASGGCVGTMQGKVADADGWCAGFIDYVYGGYDFWRGDSFLPGD